MYLLLTVCAVILQIAQCADPKCSLDGTKLVCIDVNNDELIENIKKYQPTDVKCYDGTFTKLNLQQLDIQTRKKLQKIEIIDLLNDLDFDVNTFNGVENLKTLTLANTTITKMEEKLFEPLTKLEEANIIYCSTRKRGNLGFKYTPQLRKLSITNKPIYHVLDKWFHYIPNLVELDFSDTSIASIDKDAFKALKKLQKIVLHKNGITKLPTELFDNNLELNYLDLSLNPINQIDMKHIVETNKNLNVFFMYDLPCKTLESKAVELQKDLQFECTQESKDGPYEYKTSCVNLRAYNKRTPNEKLIIFQVDGREISYSDSNFNGLPCVIDTKLRDIFLPIPFMI